MKIKLHLVITDAEAFIKQQYDFAFLLSDHETEHPDWLNCGEIEFDVNPDSEELLRIANKRLDKFIADKQAELVRYEARKAELVALPAPGSTI
jgi:hypothetical protein